MKGLFAMAVMKLLGVLTLICGIIPFVPYMYHNIVHEPLPSEDEWFTEDGPMHGPWNGEPVQLLILVPLLGLMILPIISFASGMYYTTKEQQGKILLYTVLVVFVQVVFWRLQLSWLYWLVD